ncbi:Protein PELOTA 2 [Trifolium repens]|nr:Protein PELOTA 2 [Trifolium repens]WJX58533.1 Protein PELOTA 2 [Trifolium repens]
MKIDQKSISVLQKFIVTNNGSSHSVSGLWHYWLLLPFKHQVFLRHIDFNVVRCAVIASPGFTKDQFHRHLFLEAERRQLRPIIENKSRIILAHASSGYKWGLVNG